MLPINQNQSENDEKISVVTQIKQKNAVTSLTETLNEEMKDYSVVVKTLEDLK